MSELASVAPGGASFQGHRLKHLHVFFIKRTLVRHVEIIANGCKIEISLVEQIHSIGVVRVAINERQAKRVVTIKRSNGTDLN
jgi:hypothetical protein